jgi:PHD/YefM family antitoxin component YafN of YafNO toxin-antitoxin module
MFDQALNVGPQTISRRGRPVAIMVSADEWARIVATTETEAEITDTSGPSAEDASQGQ